MNRILAILMLASLAVTARATTVRVNLVNWTSGAVAKRLVTIAARNTPAGLSTTNGTAGVMSDTFKTNTPTSGIFYLSNVVAGSYTLTCAGDPQTSFTFLVTNSAEVLNAWDLRTETPPTGSATLGYTRDQIDDLLANFDGTGGLNTNQVESIIVAAASDGTLTNLTISGPTNQPGSVSLRDGASQTRYLTLEAPNVVTPYKWIFPGSIGTGFLKVTGIGTNGTVTYEEAGGSGLTTTFTNLIDLDEWWIQAALYAATNNPAKLDAMNAIHQGVLDVRGGLDGVFMHLGPQWTVSEDPGGWDFGWLDPHLFGTNVATGDWYQFDGQDPHSIATFADIESATGTKAETNNPILFNPITRYSYLPLGSAARWESGTNYGGLLHFFFIDDFGDGFTNLVFNIDGSTSFGGAVAATSYSGSGAGLTGVAKPADVTAATNAPSITNWINFRMIAHSVLSNLLNLASYTFTNQPRGGTNISLRTVGGTNYFDTIGNLNNWSGITTASKQQSNGVLQDLSGNGIAFPGTTSIQSNINCEVWRTGMGFIPTNSAISNIILQVGRTNVIQIWATNNLTFTNFASTLRSNEWCEIDAFIMPQLVDRGVNWGTLGAPGYGVRIFTNVTSPMWTTLTNGKTYWVQWKFRGTNGHVRISLEE